LPFLPCYKHYGLKASDFPIAALYQSQILSLPMYPELTQEMQVYIAQEIRNYEMTL
jgi:dTDP-4-amino-4,6-dideoxygalactose transaminase